MGDVSADAHPSVVLELFLAQIRVPVVFLTKLCILALLRNRLRLNDVTLDTAHLTDLGSKTGYRRLTSLNMSYNLLIHHAGS